MKNNTLDINLKKVSKDINNDNDNTIMKWDVD